MQGLNLYFKHFSCHTSPCCIAQSLAKTREGGREKTRFDRVANFVNFDAPCSICSLSPLYFATQLSATLFAIPARERAEEEPESTEKESLLSPTSFSAYEARMKLNPFAAQRQESHEGIAMENKLDSREEDGIRFDIQYRIKYAGCAALVVFNIVSASMDSVRRDLGKLS